MWIFKMIFWIDFVGTFSEIVFRRNPDNAIDDKSLVMQAMASGRQATSRYLN